MDYIWKLFSNYNPSYIRVCQEKHSDGEDHIHLLLQCEKRFNIQRADFCDITEPSDKNKTYHPNMQVPRNDAAVHDYVSKDGNFQERGVLKAARTSPKKNRDEVWGDILQQSTSSSEFLQRVEKEQPFVYATQLRQMQYLANHKWPPTPQIYIPHWTQFMHVPADLQDWADTNVRMVMINDLNRLRFDDRFDLMASHESVVDRFIIHHADLVEAQANHDTLDFNDAGTRGETGPPN
jgi:hypothetical protein